MTNVWEYKGNVSKIVGNHTMRFGGELTSSTFESIYANANYRLRIPANRQSGELLARPGNSHGLFSAQCAR